MKNVLNGCTFTELALAYLPHDTPKAACRTLRSWVMGCRPLAHELQECGLVFYLKPGRRQRLTPRQVRCIFRYLGEP